jgi:signal transduction histidine kinase
VRDDGKGFDVYGLRPVPYGLLNVQERACALGGAVTLASAPGQGTALTVRIPIAMES